MIVKYAIFLALGITSALASPINGESPCGTHISQEALASAEAHFQANQVVPRADSPGGSAAETYPVNIHWHVISKDKTPQGGNVPASQIAKNVAVLNKAYQNTGIKFTLAETTRTVNPDWFKNAGPGTPQQTAMKKKLRRGRAADINVYSVGHIPNGLGYATYPASYKSAPNDDGVVLLFTTLPGGSSARYNLGHTLTHQIGHWFGLLHTYQNGCNSPGDMVDDTPAEAKPAYGCPKGRDTCSSAGLDPIHNYMNSVDDSCMTNFTPGQAKRIRSQFVTYRHLK